MLGFELLTLWGIFQFKRKFTIPADTTPEKLYGYQVFVYTPFLKDNGIVKFTDMDDNLLDFQRRTDTCYVVQMDVNVGVNEFMCYYGS